MASTQSEVKALFDSQYAAIRTKDLDRLMSHYSRDVVYFDVVPPQDNHIFVAGFPTIDVVS
jgi:ketosteroid isomerase-like protein